jgi:hypothetical protein
MDSDVARSFGGQLEKDCDVINKTRILICQVEKAVTS